ncbi:MAG: substrate-binding domain-containing protein [Dehalococcoidia bacterium]|nr:substrate-binding domain-containing protein [Dehalococcoidia bacterium]
MRLTKLFVVIFVALLIVIGAIAAVQFADRANNPVKLVTPSGPIKITIASAVAAEPWISAAAKAFSGKEYMVNDRKQQILVEVFPIDGVTALAKWANGEFQTPPTAWVAESRDWVNQANAVAADRTKQDIFLAGGQYRDQSVSMSPEIWAIFKSRSDVLQKKFGRPIDWQVVYLAATSKGWADLGGSSAWGRFKLVIPHPKRDPAGLAAIVSAAGAYYDKPAVSADELKDLKFLAWLKDMLNTVVDFQPYGAENMLLYGPSAGDAGQVLENYLLLNAESIEKRWQDGIQVYYPDPVAWYDFPFTIYMGKEKETSAAEKDAAVSFKQFLLSKEQQVATLRFGLRPASPDVATDDPASLIKKYAKMGFQERVPSASKMRQASRTALVQLGTWFVDNYEK